MNAYSQDNLSPLPIAPVPCDLPYGLTWDDLGPALPDLDDRAASQAQAWLSHVKQGLNGGSNSCILTLSYPTQDDRVDTRTVFIKSNDDPARAEGARYRFLRARGIPTPELLVSVRRDSAEIIVLEFLPRIGIDLSSDSDRCEVLSLLAGLNSIQDSPEAAAADAAPVRLDPAASFEAGVLAALREAQRASGRDLAFDAQRWFEAYLSVRDAYQALPHAMTHGEFYFQQLGWAARESGRQLVLFDLETLALRPRFADMAGILRSLSKHPSADEAAWFDSASMT